MLGHAVEFIEERAKGETHDSNIYKEAISQAKALNP